MKASEFNPFDYLETDDDRARYVAECALADFTENAEETPVMTGKALAFAERKYGKRKALAIYFSVLRLVSSDDEMSCKFREAQTKNKKSSKQKAHTKTIPILAIP